MTEKLDVISTLLVSVGINSNSSPGFKLMSYANMNEFEEN
jgi:hypothetical protein